MFLLDIAYHHSQLTLQKAAPELLSEVRDHSLVDFYPCDAMLARVIAIATCLSVRPSVRLSVHLSVRHAPVLCQNEES